MNALPESVDVLIVGAGIYGATAAYESSRRGLSVLLIDRDDFGAGASQNSLKIAHGGLRYLKSFDLPRVRESIEERRRLLQVAPHLVRPLRCRLELSPLSMPNRVLFRAGLVGNTWFTRHCNHGVATSARLPRSRYPRWSDALIEDTERLLLGFIETAVALGKGRCHARNYVGVGEYLREDGRVVGARLSDGTEIGVGVVIDCTGVSRRGQAACLSMNLVVSPLKLTAGGEAVALRHPSDHRNIFLVPWRDRTMIGTYDRDYPAETDRPHRIEPAWAEEFLDWLRPVHPSLAALTRDDVHLVHFGVLPKDATDDHHPGRRFSVGEEEPGVLRVVGVKYTTARGVSSLAVQMAAQILGRDPLPDRFEMALPPLLDSRDLVRDFIGDDPELASPLLPGQAGPKFGEVLYAVELEQARTLSDVLFRRLGLASAGHPGADVVDSVARAVEEIRGWTRSERNDQIEAFETDPHFVFSNPPLSTPPAGERPTHPALRPLPGR